MLLFLDDISSFLTDRGLIFLIEQVSYFFFESISREKLDNKKAEIINKWDFFFQRPVKKQKLWRPTGALARGVLLLRASGLELKFKEQKWSPGGESISGPPEYQSDAFPQSYRFELWIVDFKSYLNSF